jgi:hypothetical protein
MFSMTEPTVLPYGPGGYELAIPPSWPPLPLPEELLPPPLDEPVPPLDDELLPPLLPELLLAELPLPELLLPLLDPEPPLPPASPPEPEPPVLDPLALPVPKPGEPGLLEQPMTNAIEPKDSNDGFMLKFPFVRPAR